METFLLDTNQLMLGSMVLNATLMVSFLGVTLSQRSAFNRLEAALTAKSSALAASSVAGLLTPSINDYQNDIRIEMPEVLNSECESEPGHLQSNQYVSSASFCSFDSISKCEEVKTELVIFS